MAMTAAVILLFLGIWMIVKGMYAGAGVVAFIFIGAVRFIYACRQGFIEVKVYNDYLTVGDKSRSVRTIYFRDIKSAGILNSEAMVSRQSYFQRVRNEQLIVLLRSSERLALPQDLLDPHDLSAIIQSRIS
ncbi:MAG: hypothetical protein JSS76_17350 [Bacteroidetes bacterium]|nr:hypothetical protein [Bacteroidota bacterium]MBS1686508.1 hypothetical protein [Bacteroidota bacterium]